jgi:hypothetical protein
MPLPFLLPSSVRVYRACSWQAVAFSAGGDGGRRARPRAANLI